eukprot:SM000025S08443  [mRNA]  locus=s25:788987:791560:+ [translate_table: standard]
MSKWVRQVPRHGAAVATTRWCSRPARGALLLAALLLCGLVETNSHKAIYPIRSRSKASKVAFRAAQKSKEPEDSKSELYAGSSNDTGFTAQGMDYQGGPVMVADLSVYIIWYGAWPNSSKLAPIRNFIAACSSDGGTQPSPSAKDWWRLAALYQDGNGQKVTSHLTLKNETYDSYSQGASLMNGVFPIVQRALDLKVLPVDANGVYVVITSKDVAEGAFCSAYCGYHDATTYIAAGKSTAIKFAFMGDSSSTPDCLYGCAPIGIVDGTTTSPSGDQGIDGIVNILGHELAEAATDPIPGTGWSIQDGGPNQGAEVADLCAWQFGTTDQVRTARSSGGSYAYNLQGPSGQKYMVQILWDPLRGDCELTPAPTGSVSSPLPSSLPSSTHSFSRSPQRAAQ